MTPERAQRICQGVAQSRRENAGRLVVPPDVIVELKAAGFIDPDTGDVDVDALSELAQSGEGRSDWIAAAQSTPHAQRRCDTEAATDLLGVACEMHEAATAALRAKVEDAPTAAIEPKVLERWARAVADVAGHLLGVKDSLSELADRAEDAVFEAMTKKDVDAGGRAVNESRSSSTSYGPSRDACGLPIVVPADCQGLVIEVESVEPDRRVIEVYARLTAASGLPAYRLICALEPESYRTAAWLDDLGLEPGGRYVLKFVPEGLSRSARVDKVTIEYVPIERPAAERPSATEARPEPGSDES